MTEAEKKEALYVAKKLFNDYTNENLELNKREMELRMIFSSLKQSIKDLEEMLDKTEE